VPVEVVSDENALRPTIQPTEKLITDVSISPDGKRVLFAARGDLFTVPAENGAVKDLTQSPDVAERYPSWSPDGKSIAYWSDRSGEYELTLREAGEENKEKKLTSYGAGYRYNIFWSPDSKKLAFIDKAMKIQIYDRITGQTIPVDQGLRMMDGNLQGFSPSWSPDSRWLAYDRDLPNGHQRYFFTTTAIKSCIPLQAAIIAVQTPLSIPRGNTFL